MALKHADQCQNNLLVVLLCPLVVKYQVLVRTGELTGADTDANVYVVLYGERGDTGRRRLVYSENPINFREGQVWQFC